MITEYGNLLVRCPFCGSLMAHRENHPTSFVKGMRIIYSCPGLDSQFHIILDSFGLLESCRFISMPGFELKNQKVNF